MMHRRVGRCGGTTRGGRRLIRQLDIESMYGLVHVVDPDNDAADIPVSRSAGCSSTGSCVAVPVRPYVDGPVALWLGPAAAMPAGGVEIFSGSLDTPGGTLAITLPEEEGAVLALDVGERRVEITIAVDDPASAAAVWVGARVSAG